MTDFDATLRDSLGRLAVPADPSGVAKAIQARVDSGDPGTPTSPRGFGGPPAPRGWLPLIGLAIVAIIGGGAIGLSGVVRHPVDPSLTASTGVGPDGAALYGCPGGPVVSFARPGERVLAVARSADNGYLGIRNPQDTADTVWIESRAVKVDAHTNPIESLPVEACPMPTVSSVAVAPTAPHPPAPAKPTAPTKPTAPDTTPPVLGVPSASRGSAGDPVCVNSTSDPSREYAIITVSATDNRAVTGVSVNWSGPSSDSGSGSMTRSGSNWRLKYDPVSTTDTGTVSITLQARDAAGNKSTVGKIDLEQLGCVG